MTAAWGIANNEKLALGAIAGCDSNVRRHLTLPGQTVIILDVGAIFDPQWRDDLGRLRVQGGVLEI